MRDSEDYRTNACVSVVIIAGLSLWWLPTKPGRVGVHQRENAGDGSVPCELPGVGRVVHRDNDPAITNRRAGIGCAGGLGGAIS